MRENQNLLSVLTAGVLFSRRMWAAGCAARCAERVRRMTKKEIINESRVMYKDLMYCADDLCEHCSRHCTQYVQRSCYRKLYSDAGDLLYEVFKYLSKNEQDSEDSREIESNAVVHPAHYNTGKIEVWDAITDWGLDFLLGNVVKYAARAGKKDNNSRLQDLEKARAYIERAIEDEHQRTAAGD